MPTCASGAGEADAAGDVVALGDVVLEAVMDGVPVAEKDAAAEGDAVMVLVPVPVALALGVGVAEGVDEKEVDGVPLSEAVGDALSAGEGAVSGDGSAVMSGVGAGVTSVVAPSAANGWNQAANGSGVGCWAQTAITAEPAVRQASAHRRCITTSYTSDSDRLALFDRTVTAKIAMKVGRSE